MKRKSLILIVIILVFSTFLFPDMLDDITKKGTLTVGIASGYYPFEYKNKEGKLQGFDISMAQKIGEELGVEVEFIELKFDELLPKVAQGEFDLAISAITITAERKRDVDFTDTYFKTGLTFLLNKSFRKSPEKELKKPGMKIGVVRDTTGDKYARKNFQQAEIKYYKKEIPAAVAVQDKIIDAFIYDEPYLRMISNVFKQTKVYNEFLTVEEYAIALKKNEKTFLLKLNEILKNIKKDESYKKLQETWFRVDIEDK
ncbi:MAG: transporter substrate-binding domain-containing protein [Actinomycetia bacterium]|nr:transporter substrate-binding domain-containing protein [Actinomycetes bacterium]